MLLEKDGYIIEKMMRGYVVSKAIQYYQVQDLPEKERTYWNIFGQLIICKVNKRSYIYKIKAGTAVSSVMSEVDCHNFINIHKLKLFNYGIHEAIYCTI